MLRTLRRVLGRSGYHRGMRRNQAWDVPSEAQSDDVKEWAGYWVAVVDGKVIAAATTSTDLVTKMHEMGAKAEAAVAQFVTPPSDTIMIGVG